MTGRSKYNAEEKPIPERRDDEKRRSPGLSKMLSQKLRVEVEVVDARAKEVQSVRGGVRINSPDAHREVVALAALTPPSLAF